MITRTIITFQILLLLIISGCTTDPNAPLLEREPEVKEYFETLDQIVDEYCLMIEKMASDASALEEKEKNGEEASFMDGVNMLKNMGTSAFKIAQLANKVDELQQKHPQFEKKLNTADFQEFMSIYSKMIERFYNMAKKLEAMEKKETAA